MLKVESRGLRSLKHWADPALLLIPDPLGMVPVGELAALILPGSILGEGINMSLDEAWLAFIEPLLMLGWIDLVGMKKVLLA